MTTGAAADSTNKSALAKKALSDNSMWAILIVLALIMGVATSGKFLMPANILTIFQNESGVGIVALGVAFTIISHGIDLSVGSLVSLTSVVSAAFAQQAVTAGRIFGDFGPWNGVVAALIGVAIGAAFGAINGWFIAYTKIHPFIATLGTMSACRGAANLFTNGQPVSGLIPSYDNLGGLNLLDSGISSIVVFFILFCLLSWFILTQTRFGRNIYAIGGNDVAARVAGVKVEKNLVAIYAYSGLCAGAGGVLMAARNDSGNPVLGLNLELDAIAAATIGGVSQMGGVGRVSGVIAGVLIMGIVKSALVFLNVSPYMTEIVKGIIIVGAVVIDMRKFAHSN